MKTFFENQNLIYKGDNFKKVIFDNIKQEVPVPKLTENILTEHITDKQLIKKYNCKMLSADEIASTIKYLIENNKVDKGKTYIVGYTEFNGEQHSVYLYWGGFRGVWCLGANDLSSGWGVGGCFLSRNELENSEPLKTETLSEQVKTLETQMKKTQIILQDLLDSLK